MRIQMNGYIVSDNEAEMYDAFGIQNMCPEKMRNFISQVPENEELTIEINSVGGDVFLGLRCTASCWVRNAERWRKCKAFLHRLRRRQCWVVMR